MKNKNITISFLVVALVAAISVLSCKKKSSTEPPTEAATATYQIYMTDSPGAYLEVNVNVVGAEVHSDGSGWVPLTVRAGIYNLLQLNNGIDTLLASGQIPVGIVSEVRLILGSTNNTIKINNQIYNLDTPSADQSGLKLQIHTELLQNITYILRIDFDAAKSIVVTESNTYKLKPVIRIISTAINGVIKGAVLPVISQPAVMAVLGVDTFVTYANPLSGQFLIQGLAGGIYKVILNPKTPFRDTTFFNISVNVGAVTNMGTLTIK
ncbi:MAG: DUF4382 domain-containing protein [bacterium]|nr:DUF4382 domain-containing protein [bacterium]